MSRRRHAIPLPRFETRNCLASLRVPEQVGWAEDGFRPLAHHFFGVGGRTEDGSTPATLRPAAARSRMVGLRPEAGLGPPYRLQTPAGGTRWHG